MNKLAAELSMAEDKLKQMFGLEDQSRREVILPQASRQSSVNRLKRRTISTTGPARSKPSRKTTKKTRCLENELKLKATKS
jgi:hypothetical protein